MRKKYAIPKRNISGLDEHLCPFGYGTACGLGGIILVTVGRVESNWRTLQALEESPEER